MFSIVMPVWNKRTTITRAVTSVLAQHSGEFELIIVDDGSTDGSISALSGMKDDRLVIIQSGNEGPGPARNRGIEAARYEWIAFIDSDDIWMPDHLAELDSLRTLHPNADLIGTSYWCSDLKGNIQPVERDHPQIGVVNYFEAVGHGLNVICASTAAIPKSTYHHHGGFLAEIPGQDTEYWARIALTGTVVVSTRVTAIYVQGTGGISDGDREARRGKFDSLRAIALSVEMVSEQLPLVSSRRLRRGIGLYVDAYLHWRLMQCAAAGDVHSLRQIDRLALKSRRIENHIFLWISRFPDPLIPPFLWAALRFSSLILWIRKRMQTYAHASVWKPLPTSPGE